MDLGITYQAQGELDKAIKEFETYNSRLFTKREKKDSSGYKYIKQINFAKEMMNKPIPVSVTNAGNNINSNFTDAAPCISPDGKTLLFTSRRPDTKGGGIDLTSGNYYDDIYQSTWDEAKKQWSEATPVDELNSTEFDACLSLSADGNTLLLYKNVEKLTKSGDIFISTKKEGKWSSPKRLPEPINSSFFESSACFSPDGKTLYFVSERKNGYGNADIWKSTKINETTWSEPENLGPTVNTPEDEISVFAHPDGKTLFFSSKGHNSMGGYDIFKTVFENGKWSKPINLGYPINTIKDEIHFTVLAGNKTAFMAARRDDGLGDYDIYSIDLSKYPQLFSTENLEFPTVPTRDSLYKNASTWSISGNFGAMLFNGDLRQYNMYPVGSGASFAVNERKIGYGFAITKTINPLFSVQANLNAGQLAGFKRYDAPNVSQYFEADVFAWSVNGIVNISTLLAPEQRTRKAYLYFTVGVGMLNYRSVSRVLSDNSPSGNDTYINSVGYKEGSNGTKKDQMEAALMIPIGIGYKYQIDEKISAYVESTVRFTSTDKLDATVKTNNGNDRYAYTCLGITYKLEGKRKGLEWMKWARK